MLNKSLCQCEFEDPTKHHTFEGDYVCDPNICACEGNRYLQSIFSNSVITWGEIIDTSETIPITFNFKKATSKTDCYLILQFFYKWPHCY